MGLRIIPLIKRRLYYLLSIYGMWYFVELIQGSRALKPRLV